MPRLCWLWPAGTPSASSTFLLSVASCSKVSFPLPAPDLESAILPGALVPCSGERHLESKVQGLDVLLASGGSLLLSYFSGKS